MSSAEQHVAYFRFYGALNDFLADAHRQAEVRYSFWGQPAVKDAIEAQGVPHPEVDLILVDGEPVPFDCNLSADDRVSVYPWIASIPRPETALRPPWPELPRFVCDVHLGRLARYLRMMGIDTWYETDCSDSRLARIAEEDQRILLTRDLGLLKRGRVQLGAFVRAQQPRRKLAEVMERFPLSEHVNPLSRCLTCNRLLNEASSAAIEAHVPPNAREAHDRFVQCPSCEQVFWAGTHVDRMQQLIEDVTSEGTQALGIDPDTPSVS